MIVAANRNGCAKRSDFGELLADLRPKLALFRQEVDVSEYVEAIAGAGECHANAIRDLKAVTH